MKKLLLKSCLANHPVEIMYMDQRSRITHRAIFVKRIEEEQVIAFCTLREQQRTFQLENILAIQKHDELKRYSLRQAESTQMYRFLEN